MKHTRQDLKIMQGWSLERKIRVTQTRIMEWYMRYDGQVFISFSGGKDSTVLLDLARRVYPDIPAVYVDTGLEYPELRDFVKTKDNVIWLRPRYPFTQILEKYGYPIISKEISDVINGARKGQPYRLARINGELLDKNGKKSIYNCENYKYLLDAPFKISARCCYHMKKAPLNKFERQSGRHPITGVLACDTEALTAEGVTKAAVETVAENASDGAIAPLLYMLLGGAPLALTYKAINTMDSMLGYKNEKYLYFGRAAAKLDDVANYIPSRLAALLWIMAAAFTRNDAKGAWRIWRRDRRNHASPNSAQTESACAGALGVQLAGPAYYFGEYYPKPTIGDPLRPIEPEDILRADRMMYTASGLALAFGSAIRGFLGLNNWSTAVTGWATANALAAMHWIFRRTSAPSACPRGWRRPSGRLWRRPTATPTPSVAPCARR